MDKIMNWLLGCGAVTLSLIAATSAIALVFAPKIQNKKWRRIASIAAALITVVASFIQGYMNYRSGDELALLPSKIMDARQCSKVFIPTSPERCLIRDGAFEVLHAKGFWFRRYCEDANGNIELYYATSELERTDGVVCIPNYDVSAIANSTVGNVTQRLDDYIFKDKPFRISGQDSIAAHGRFCEYVGLTIAAISAEHTGWEFPDGMYNLKLYFYDTSYQIDLDIKKCRSLRDHSRVELIKEVARILAYHNLNSGHYIGDGRN